MKKKRLIRDFDYYIDEYMYNCRSRKLRPKTMISYEQGIQMQKLIDAMEDDDDVQNVWHNWEE